MPALQAIVYKRKDLIQFCAADGRVLLKLCSCQLAVGAPTPQVLGLRGQQVVGQNG